MEPDLDNGVVILRDNARKIDEMSWVFLIYVLTDEYGNSFISNLIGIKLH